MKYSQINTAKDLIKVACDELGFTKFIPKNFVDEGMNVLLMPHKNEMTFRILLEFDVDFERKNKVEEAFFEKFYELRDSIINSPIIQNQIRSYELRETDAARKIDLLQRELEDCRKYKIYFEKQFLLNHGKENEIKT